MTAPTIKHNAAKRTLDQRAPSRNVNTSDSITVYRNAPLMSGHIHNFSLTLMLLHRESRDRLVSQMLGPGSAPKSGI